MMKVRGLIFLTLLANQCTHGKFDMYLQSTSSMGMKVNNLKKGMRKMELPSQMVKMKTMVEALKILANHLKMMIMGPNTMTNNSSICGESV